MFKVLRGTPASPDRSSTSLAATFKILSGHCDRSAVSWKAVPERSSVSSGIPSNTPKSRTGQLASVSSTRALPATGLISVTLRSER